MSPVKYTVVDIFAGAGGLSLGFEWADATVIAAVESDPHHAEAYRSGHRQVELLTSPIEQTDPEEVLRSTNLVPTQLDFLVGGPPCQPFSSAGKRHGVADQRGSLVWQFDKYLRALQPRSFVLENVVGLRSIHGGSLFSELVTSFESIGYLCEPLLLDAADYGVPQSRKRLFLVGILRGKREIGEPPQTHVSATKRNRGKGEVNSHRTVRDAIWDLPGSRSRAVPKDTRDSDFLAYGSADDCEYQGLMRGVEDKVSGNGVTAHFAHILKRIRKKALPEGAIDPDTRYRRLYWDRPAFTLRAGSGSFTALRPIHPSQARVITVREAARLQSFPDFVQFSPIKKWAYQQIGNSVPPLLGKALAKHLIAALSSR